MLCWRTFPTQQVTRLAKKFTLERKCRALMHYVLDIVKLRHYAPKSLHARTEVLGPDEIRP